MMCFWPVLRPDPASRFDAFSALVSTVSPKVSEAGTAAPAPQLTAPGARTSSTGTGLFLNTLSASLPSSARLKPRRSWVPMTIKSQPALFASCKIASATRPPFRSCNSVSTSTPGLAASVFRLRAGRGRTDATLGGLLEVEGDRHLRHDREIVHHVKQARCGFLSGRQGDHFLEPPRPVSLPSMGTRIRLYTVTSL
jgi:hypothetical protein